MISNKKLLSLNMIHYTRLAIPLYRNSQIILNRLINIKASFKIKNERLVEIKAIKKLRIR